MAITSKGYERAITYAVLGELIAHGGCQYSVFGASAFQAAAGSSDREVVLQPGRAYGHGIIDDSDAPISLVGSPVSSGSRWDLVALRRTWSAEEGASVTVPVLIQGGGSRAIPTRNSGAGVLDDQPLWLARFSAGQTAVQELVDLRVWHGPGGNVGRDKLARDYLTRIGTRIRIQGITWMLDLNTSGIPTWVPDSVVVSSSQPEYVEGLGWIKVP